MAWVRHTYDRCQAHSRVRHQDFFDFTRIDVEATTNNHIFHAINNVDVAFFVPAANIAGMKLAVSERFSGRLESSVIVIHYIETATDGFISLVCTHIIVITIHHTYSKTSNGQPHSA